MMSDMEAATSLLGFLALTELFTMGLLFCIQSQIDARIDSFDTEIRAEIRASSTEVRSEFAQVRRTPKPRQAARSGREQDR